MEKLPYNISVIIRPDELQLHEDLEAYLFHHDFEFSMYDDLEEYLEDFLYTHKIDYTRSVFFKPEGSHVYYTFDVTAFNIELNNIYDTDDYDT